MSARVARASHVAPSTCTTSGAWCDGEKVNTLECTATEYIFVTSRTGFHVKFLDYHDALQFRGFLSTIGLLRGARPRCCGRTTTSMPASTRTLQLPELYGFP